MANSDTMLIQEARQSDRGLVLSVVHTSRGQAVTRQVLVPTKDLATIDSATDPVVALTTWLQERFPAALAWTAALVGTTITL